MLLLNFNLEFDTFIHEDYVKSNHKYVEDFYKISKEDFQKIFNLIKNKIKTSCTPFDENLRFNRENEI